MRRGDGEISSLETWLQDTSREVEHQNQRDEEGRRARAREEELKFEREQMKMKLEFERELEETKVKQHPAAKAEQSQQRATKLPKLEITKFKGTYEGWLPFWNKFQAEIDETNLATVTKFAYLKELLDGVLEKPDRGSRIEDKVAHTKKNNEITEIKTL